MKSECVMKNLLSDTLSLFLLYVHIDKVMYIDSIGDDVYVYDEYSEYFLTLTYGDPVLSHLIIISLLLF